MRAEHDEDCADDVVVLKQVPNDVQMKEQRRKARGFLKFFAENAICAKCKSERIELFCVFSAVSRVVNEQKKHFIFAV